MDEVVWYIRQNILPAAFSFLPGQMDTPEARAMLFAIGFQESNFRYRRQIGEGPARGFWQFERMGGVAEILQDKVTGPIIKPICKTLVVSTTPAACHEAIQHNDILAACFARLLMYRDSRPLPKKLEGPLVGWSIYRDNWRPGKPHPEKWPANFKKGWTVVEGVEYELVVSTV